MASSTREWSVEKCSVDLRDFQATTMALSRADEGQVYNNGYMIIYFCVVTLNDNN